MITAQEVIDIAFNDVNFLPSKIKSSYIDIAMYDFLRPEIGADFYDAIIADQEKQTPTPAITTFVNTYLKPSLAFYVKYVAIPDIATSLSNMGLINEFSQTSNTVSDRQRGELMQQTKNNAEALMKKAIDYLEKNSTDFPDYNTEEKVSEKVKVRGGIIF